MLVVGLVALGKGVWRLVLVLCAVFRAIRLIIVVARRCVVLVRSCQVLELLLLNLDEHHLLLELFVALDLAFLIFDLYRFVRAPRRVGAHHLHIFLRMGLFVLVNNGRRVRIGGCVMFSEEVELLAPFLLQQEVPDYVAHLASDYFVGCHFQVVNGPDHPEFFFLAEFVDRLNFPRRVEASLF